jgi:hypothetical protein
MGRGDASNVREALAPLMPKLGEDRSSVSDVFANVYGQCIELTAHRCGIFQAHRRLELYDDLANRGIRTANVPLVPGIPLPHQLEHLSKPLVVSLTANALARIICRTGASRAAFIAHCYQEALAITEEHKLVVLASHKH